MARAQRKENIISESMLKNGNNFTHRRHLMHSLLACFRINRGVYISIAIKSGFDLRKWLYFLVHI